MGATTKKTRSGIQVMAGLIGMIKPLLPVMAVAILMGCMGNLMATFITVLGGYALLTSVSLYAGNLKLYMILIIAFAVLRGILRYAEQASNHFIAFKLLAQIRHKVFAALRRLCPAKLDGSRSGNLISIITSDIELLEVFYAHTISPIAIAVITSFFMTIFIGKVHPALGALACLFYLIVGAVIPVCNGRAGSSLGQEYRKNFGGLNTTVLDNLYGLDEILQYQTEEERLSSMRRQNKKLEQTNEGLKKKENTQRVVTDAVILFAGVVMTMLATYLWSKGLVPAEQIVIVVIGVMSSFGPTAALSSLSNNLNQTLASGNRVLDILEEEPIVWDVTGGVECPKENIACEHVTFSYPEGENILSDFNAVFEKNKIHGILGKSGCGKSTLLKLLMRFYETESGTISYGKTEISGINTKSLRNGISYVTQEIFLFQDTIENNIKVAKEDATREEVIAAAKKASIHEFIESLPNGYDTKLSELGTSVSGGEKQRIGIARAFLHDAEFIFLDEPTSNIDSLNEGMILRSLEQEKQGKTVLLVSHRRSTMGICDDVTAMG